MSELTLWEHLPDELLKALKDLKTAEHQEPPIVNEYKASTLAPDAEKVITLQPQFQRCPVRIDHIIVTGPATAGQASLTASGNQVTSPGAGATIASIPAGSFLPGIAYQIEWTVDLDGTPSATDINNFQITGANIGTSIISENDGAVGHYAQQPLEVTIPAAGTANPLTIKSVAAGTAGAIYSAQLIATPLTVLVTIQLGDHIFPNLALNENGVLELSPKCLILQPRDTRQLTAAYSAQYYFGLFGYADVRTSIR